VPPRALDYEGEPLVVRRKSAPNAGARTIDGEMGRGTRLRSRGGAAATRELGRGLRRRGLPPIAERDLRYLDELEAGGIVTYWPNGQPKTQEWHDEQDHLHRDPSEGPAWKKWHENGTLAEEGYYVEGHLHRDPSEGPAWRRWNENDTLIEEIYFLAGCLHRDPAEGPAWLERAEDGTLKAKHY
jgi:hypothetical protein